MGKTRSPRTVGWLGSSTAGCAMTYGAVFLILGIELPYLSAWLNGRGFSSIEIGLIIGTPLWLRIILGPMIGIAADRYAANRLLVVALASAAAIGAFWLAHTDQITLVLILVALVLVASQSTLLAPSIHSQSRRHTVIAPTTAACDCGDQSRSSSPIWQAAGRLDGSGVKSSSG